MLDNIIAVKSVARILVFNAVNIKNELIEMCKENLKRELNYDMTENDIIEA